MYRAAGPSSADATSSGSAVDAEILLLLLLLWCLLLLADARAAGTA